MLNRQINWKQDTDTLCMMITVFNISLVYLTGYILRCFLKDVPFAKFILGYGKFGV
jgi:hypothetical protein